MICPLCTAKHDATAKQFHVSHGKPLSEKTFNSRCCHYARARGKEGCINPCNVIDPAETLEGRLGEIEKGIHPEVREYLNLPPIVING